MSKFRYTGLLWGEGANPVSRSATQQGALNVVLRAPQGEMHIDLRHDPETGRDVAKVSMRRHGGDELRVTFQTFIDGDQ